ncbi:phage tail protein [Tritonibacter mobilis]|uniref:Tip attachment protein J domain-containing protein n=1 Tax=Tritonibacter mobilis F1926 TaxID=1265309 RepID=A0A1B1A8M2_9RHOB|nr:phage tail protein [Tritonibacter mobilis]ANP42903.1 hypothetical protein K529_019255 [Tritonibacter mobilis F1926]
MAVFSAIAAAVTAISSWTIGLGALGTFAVGNFLLRAAVQLGVSALAKAFAKKSNPIESDPFSIQGNVRTGGSVPRSFGVGEYLTAGSLVWHSEWGRSGDTPNAYYTQVIALSDLPVSGLKRVFIDGQSVTLEDVGAEGGLAAAEYRVNGQDHAWVKFYDGTQTVADSFLTGTVNAGSPRGYSAARVGVGIAYAIVTFRINQEIFAGFPRTKFVLDGVKMYDISKDSTQGGDGDHRWNDPATWGGDGDKLPAVQAYNLARGLFFGGAWFYGLQGLTSARLPADHWIAQIEKCRAGVQGEQGLEPLYRCAGEITVNSEMGSAFEAILTSCAGRMSEVGGVFKIYVGAPDAPIAHFNDDDILSLAPQTFTPFFGLSDTINGVIASYPSPDEGYVMRSTPPLYNSQFESEDGGRRLMTDVQLSFVPYPAQAQRLLHGELAAARRARRHTHSLPAKFRLIEPGDVVEWSSARNGYQAKQFRVDGVIDLPNCDLIVDLTEVDPSDHGSWDHDTDYRPVIPFPVVPARPAAQAVVGLTISSFVIAGTSGGANRPGLLVRWYTLVDDIAGLKFEVRLASSGVVVAQPQTHSFETGSFVISDGILPDVGYQVRAKYIPGVPRGVEWSEWLDVVSDDIRIALDDLADEVTQAIDTAQAAADLAAQDATQALLDAATVQDNLTNAVASLSVDYTAVQIAAQAAEDAQLAAETAENSAAEHRGVVVSTAIDLLPSDFRDDDRYWAHAISGDPATKGGVTSSIGFRDVAGQGRVAWVTADLASNAHLAPKGYISPVQGRRYRMTIVARHLGPLGAGPHFSSQWRKFNENYGFEGSFGQQNISFATQDTWETFASDYTMSGDDAAYLFAFPYFIAAYQNPSAEIEIARVLIEDVTESAGAAGAASAAANSASVAGASETEAGQSAAAAQTAKTAAETARAGAEVAQTTAATSASDAENAAASAATSANIAARIGPRGACVIDDPLFDSYQQGGWNAWQTAPVALPNEVYPTGNTLHFDIGAVNAGTYIANSSTWSGAQNADAYVVEVEFTLLSGAVTGAGVLLDWDVPGDRRRQIPLSDMLRDPVTIGQVTVAQAVFTRPDMGGATFVDHDLYLMANFSSFGLTAKNIKFHRMSVRVATNEELGQGQVASQISAAVTDEAIARASAVDALTSVLTSQQSQIDGISSSVTQQGTTLATLDGKVQAMTGLTATTVDVNGETRISGIQATSYANPDGSGGSLLKLIGDDVVAEGTLSANKLVVGLGKNLLGNTDFADGLQGWDNKGGLGSGREDASIGLRTAGSSWAGKYYPTLVVYQASAGTDGYLDITYRPPMVNGVAPAYGVSISDNVGWVEASVYASAHRCIVALRMEFRNHNGDVLSYTPLLATATALSDSGNPDKWPRLWGKAEVPTGAAYVTIHIRKMATNAGSNDSWMFLHKPQLVETTGAASQPTPYSPQGSTLISGNRLATGAVTAEKIDVNELSAITANIGHFKSAASGERVEIEDDRIRVFDSSDVARVVIGRLT